MLSDTDYRICIIIYEIIFIAEEIRAVTLQQRRRADSFEDQPGFNRIPSSDFPIYWGGIGKRLIIKSGSLNGEC